MKIEFESTIDDYVDSNLRLLARAKEGRSWRRQGIMLSALVSGLGSGIFVFAVASLTMAIWVGIIGGIIAAITSAMVTWDAYPKAVKRRLVKYYRELFGQRDSFPVLVEVTESGINKKQLGTQIIFEWANVEDIAETEDRLEIYTRDGNVVFIKKSGFASDDEYQQFVKVTRRYLDASRSSSNWLQAG